MATDQKVTVNVRAQVEELRQRRWDQVAPVLAEVLGDSTHLQADTEDETVDEPSVVGVVEADENSAE
jgi:hypothetical protein